MTQAIGLLAGSGAFPLLFAAAAKKRGLDVVAVGLRGETDPRLAAEVAALTWVRVGQLGKIIAAFQKAAIERVAMAGAVDKRRLFGRARPDWLGLCVLGRVLLRRDDSLLRAIASEFERRSISIIDSTVVMPEALAPEGVLTRRRPTEVEERDLRFGLEIAHAIGRLDIGQTVVVKEGVVVALEAIEGTDACIRRGATLAPGAVVVKAAKPNQDLRFDVPAVGPLTITTMREAGARVLGVEAGRTLMLQCETMLDEADRVGLCVVGLTARDMGDIGVGGAL